MKHDITSLNDGIWRVKLGGTLLQPYSLRVIKGDNMAKRHLDDPPSVEYCFVCMSKLTAETGRVVLRPTKDTGERSAIPLNERRVTMCEADATTAVASGDYARV